jgi:hypothetical protein
LGDFFGLGQGKVYYFDNPVQAIGTIRGLNCFWPMPFAESARVEIVNESDIKASSIYYYVDWRSLNRFPKNLGYFHAQYRQDFPNPDGKNYLFLDTSGARGHYMGVHLTIHTQVDGWWGEGDDIFTIDGESTPSLWGTGSEDYFCGAWGFGETFYNDYFGMPYREKDDHSADNFWNVYRYHIESPIPFKDSIRVEMEHGTAGYDNTHKEGWNNDYSSVAYWYMEKPVPLKGSLPPAEERISHYRPLFVPDNVIELHKCDVIPSSENIRASVQGLEGFPRAGSAWYYSDHLFCISNQPGSTVTLNFTTEQDHQGPSVFHLTRSADYGAIRVSLNDQVLLENMNCYSPRVESLLLDLGELTLPAGIHTLKIETTGKDERSQGYRWGVDYLRIGGQPLETEAKTKKITD